MALLVDVLGWIVVVATGGYAAGSAQLVRDLLNWLTAFAAVLVG